MKLDYLTRQQDIIPVQALNQRISQVGCGAIGSMVAISLTKMGLGNYAWWDFDHVSNENMNCQWFPSADIGKPKALALAEIVKMFSGFNVAAHPEKWDGQELSGIVIASVDSMAVRKQMWEHCKDNFKVQWFIDPRMGSEYAKCFVMNPRDPKDIESYEHPQWMHSDAEGLNEPCTAKATMYTAMLIAGHVAKQVKDLITGAVDAEGKPVYSRSTEWDIKFNNQITYRKKE